MLIANQKSSDGIEVYLSFIEVRSKGIEEFGRYQEWDVLKVWIEIETVTGNVMSIVVPLPPPNTDTCEAIPSEDLSKTIEFRGRHHLVMP